MEVGPIFHWMRVGWRDWYADIERVDAVSSATWHYSGSVLATCSGQRHDDDGLSDIEGLENSIDLSGAPKIDNSLKLWAIE